MRYWLLLLLCLPAVAGEKAAYDSNGRIVSMISASGDVAIASGIFAVLPTGKAVPLQVRQEGSGPVRQGRELAWTSGFTLPDGGRGRLEWKSEEDAAGLRYSVQVTADSPLEVSAIELRIDLPHTDFVAGSATPEGAAPVQLAAVRQGGPVLWQGQARGVRVQNAAGTVAFQAGFDTPAAVALVDRWDSAGRSFQLRAAMVRAPMAAGATAGIRAALLLDDRTPASGPVHLAIDAAAPRFHFDGFGGNYCWNNQSPIAAYTLDHLKIAWARSEMKAIQWDHERGAPGGPDAEIRSDLETMRKLRQMGARLVISVWWLPERFYTDSYEKPRSARFRTIDPEKWDDLLDLLGSYLLYAKREYGVEPDLFSFNESNIGIYVGLTPESHAAAIRRIGAYFQKIGLKTKMLLGDAASPRDTYRFVLDAASDPAALPYIGAVAFHSWGGGTPQQYTAWGDVAEWLHLPLLVTEMGVDAAAYYTRSFDSYDYGLREARMAQELLQYARPQGAEFWQFTNDYALARTGAGGTVEPTARFWLMKHFTDLTPAASDALTAASDQPTVLATAFRKEGAYAVHVLNLGAARDAIVTGLPVGTWQAVETTEEIAFATSSAADENGAVRLRLPARSLVTLQNTAVRTDPRLAARP